VSKLSITIVGPGRLGRALAQALVRAGYAVDEIIFSSLQSLRKNRRALSPELRLRAVTRERAHFQADIVWLCVPDTQIKGLAQTLKSATKWNGKVVFHSSGALGSDVLQPLRARGAKTASVHPLMTFVHRSAPSLKGIPFAIEGDRAALRTAGSVIKMLGGDDFVVKERHKPLYHAWGTLLSPLLLSYLVTAEQVAAAIGISANNARKKALPIARQTLLNYVTVGPAAAFSGPLVRGDIRVVQTHLKALKKIPEAKAIYVASARSALRHLPVRHRKHLGKLLKA